MAGASSAIIPATTSSGAYVFIGQSIGLPDSQGTFSTYDSIIPITVDASGTPSVDPSRQIQYINDYWNTPTHNALAHTYASVVQYDLQNPQSGLNNSHVV